MILERFYNFLRYIVHLLKTATKKTHKLVEQLNRTPESTFQAYSLNSIQPVVRLGHPGRPFITLGAGQEESLHIRTKCLIINGNINHPSNSRSAKELPLRTMPSHGGSHHKQALTAAADIRQLTLAPIVRSSTESPVYEPPPDFAAFGLYTPLGEANYTILFRFY